MGYLLKEALKTMCGVSQWSYAVFWRIGCQNRKLLIWEDCYYNVMPCSVLPGSSESGNQGQTLEELEKCWLSPESRAKHLGAYVGEQMHLLLNKMMVANQVYVVGEGLVGRSVFTGNHEWIISGTFNGMVHPPEVVKEVHLQFSAGMQTVATIPVIPHGVIQLGSPLAITENVAFIQDVKSLIFQLEHVPGALLLDSHMRDESVEEFALPLNQIKPVSLDSYGNMKNFISSDTLAGGPRTDLFHDSSLANQTLHSLSTKSQDNLDPTASTFLMYKQSVPISHGDKCQPSTITKASPSHALKELPGKNVDRAEVIPLAQDLLLERQTSLYVLDPGSNHSQAIASGCSDDIMKKHVASDVDVLHCANQKSVACSNTVQSQIHINENQFREPYDDWTSGGTGVHITDSSNQIVDAFSSLVDQPVSRGVLSGCSFPAGFPDKFREKDLYEGLGVAFSNDTDNMPFVDLVPDNNKTHDESDVPSCMTFLSCIQSSAGDDLFDALGVDFKNKILNDYICNPSKNGKNMINKMKEKSQDSTFVAYSNCDKMLESGMFSSSCSDHLLDAVVSGIHSAATQTSNDNLSCRTTLAKGCSSSIPNISPRFGLCSSSHPMHELFGHSKPSMRSPVGIGATSIGTAFRNNDAGNCVQTSSFDGSHISSCVEQGPSLNHENTAVTANSKKFNLIGKPARKRLKPGENPRPRPKDRQMIQDRVKELREIIPNGGKCSIDSLLERTIKHMLFLQSVTKHADNLKQTVDSKIIDKNGGLLLKDNFEGGATWAYEVGSQAKICPLVVEDLNTPRQLLVEMLCEKRGFFLEIADVIRGMGLTILKGVMETRNNKIWACFRVEANRDVTRMEIFLSLIPLLDNT